MPRLATIDITVAQARALQIQGVQFQVATIHQTMGPHWKEIIWICGAAGRHCHVSKTHNVRQIRGMIQ